MVWKVPVSCAPHARMVTDAEWAIAPVASRVPGGTTTTSDGVSAGEGCPASKAIVADVMPDPGYASQLRASGPANISGLTNGTAYAVGVVARDKIGNIGRMSNVACGTPMAISDFFSIYRQEGGRAGGGCTVAPPRDGAVAFAFGGLAMLGIGLAFRRRSLRSARRASTSRGSR